ACATLTRIFSVPRLRWPLCLVAKSSHPASMSIGMAIQNLASPRSRASMTNNFDLVVIGGGPAGICGANTAAIFGKRVALVEKLGKVGGAGINTGTIPSKTLREAALA